MNVKNPAAKGGDVICIEPTATLTAAAQLLCKHRIGAVVTRRAASADIIERDIVRAITEHGAEARAAGWTGDDSATSSPPARMSPLSRSWSG
jgi:CBS domain-containing protein